MRWDTDRAAGTAEGWTERELQSVSDRATFWQIRDVVRITPSVSSCEKAWPGGLSWQGCPRSAPQSLSALPTPFPVLCPLAQGSSHQLLWPPRPFSSQAWMPMCIPDLEGKCQVSRPQPSDLHACSQAASGQTSHHWTACCKARLSDVRVCVCLSAQGGKASF